MFKLIDFAQIYCTSIYTIRRRIKHILPMFKRFNPNTTKHFYTVEESKQVIKAVGIPPNTKILEQYRSKFPELFED